MIVLTAVFFGVPAQSRSQGDDTDNGVAESSGTNKFESRGWQLKRGSKEYGFEIGFAPMQPTFFSGRKEYDTSGRKFALASFRFGRVIGTAKGVTTEYIFELIPVSFAIKNEVSDESEKDQDSDKYRTVRQTTFGVGIQPVGFRFLFKPRERVKPFVQMGAGFIFTAKPIPVPGSPNYNFAGDFGGGLMYSLSREKTVSFGYKYFHMSNMNIGKINPGYNANIFYVGYSYFYK